MKRTFITVAVLLALAWCIYALAADSIAGMVATRFGNALMRLGQGKIVSVSHFVQRRMFEALWLVTLALVWAGLHGMTARWWSRRAKSPQWAWIAHSVLAFACLNLWLAQAQRTVLFWGLMWQGDATQNLTRFYIKLLLAREEHPLQPAALVGSSQTRAQIDEELLNPELVALLRTTELHYPGSKAYDVFLLQPIVARARPKYLICYMTVGYFYCGSDSEISPNFMTFAEVPDLIRRGGYKFLSAERMGVGLLGDAFPVFRLREVLAQRFLGAPLAQLKQKQYNTALETDLAERGRRLAQTYRSNEESRFQKLAFEDFIRRCERDNQRVVLLVGQMNPFFERALDPQIREEMLLFLREIARQHPNVTLLENLPEQTTADYQDLTHVTKPAQGRFTHHLAERLRPLLTDANPILR